MTAHLPHSSRVNSASSLIPCTGCLLKTTSIDIDLVRYPSCVHSGNLEWTDKSYVRSVINTAEDNAMPRKIRIAVIYCRRCSRYHALIPWGLIPFTSFTYFFLIRALYSYYIRNSENLMRTAEEFGIERSTLRRWKKRFEEEAGAVAAIHELSSRLSSTPESSRLRGSDLSALRDRKKEGYAMQAKLTIQERANMRQMISRTSAHSALSRRRSSTVFPRTICRV